MKYMVITTAFAMLALVACQQKNTTDHAADTLAADTAQIRPVEPGTEATDAEDSNKTPEESTPQGGKESDYTYEGFIDGKIKVRLNFFDYNEQKARLVYLSTKKIIDLEPVTTTTGAYEVLEKVNGKTTGIWKLQGTGEAVMTGTWNSPDGSKQMPIKLTRTEEPFDNFLPKEEIRTGFYEKRDLNDDPETKQEYPELYVEELRVKNMAGSTIYFDLYIQGSPPGMHIGTIYGIAAQKGKSYVYNNGEGCEISMTFSGSNVTLGQKGTDTDCGFGAFIGAAGTLEKKTD